MGVVAEEIDTKTNLEILRKMGCNFGQGYFFLDHFLWKMRSLSWINYYRLRHQVKIAKPKPNKGKITKDNQEIRLACKPFKIIRRFLGSLGRIESDCSLSAANHCTLLRKTSPLSCSPNHWFIAKLELPITTILEVIFPVFFVVVELELFGLGEIVVEGWMIDDVGLRVGEGETSGVCWATE